MSVLAELDDLRGAEKKAAEFRSRAELYRASAEAEAHPVRRENFLSVALSYEQEADALAPKVSRLRRAVEILERALRDE